MSETVYSRLCKEIDADMAILSDATRMRLKTMLANMAEDAHKRGIAEGIRRSQPEKPPAKVVGVRETSR